MVSTHDLSFLLTPASEIEDLEVIPTSISSINDVVFGCGGLPRGRAIEIFAEESQGKSTLAQWFVIEAQKQGLVCAWADAENSFDKVYATKAGIDLSNLQMIDYGSGNDLMYKLKLLIALNLFDIIVVDSINAVIPDTISTARYEDLNMNERLHPAKMWSEFFRQIESGYKIADPIESSKNKIVNVKTNKPVSVINQRTLQSEEDDELHKLKQKKTCLILINHKNVKIGSVFGQKFYTPGGKKKDFVFSARLDIKRKKTKTGQENRIKNILKYRIVEVKAEKNKVGVPLGVAQLKMDRDGKIYPLTDDDTNELKDIELEDDIEDTSPVTKLNVLSDKLKGFTGDGDD